MADVVRSAPAPTLWALIALGVACSSDPPAPTTGLDLEVQYDSSLSPEALAVVLTPAQGAIDNHDLTPPLDLDPPGVRRPRFALDLTGGPTGMVEVKVDAKRGRVVVASGVVQVTLAPGQMVPAVVVLGGGNPCGPGGCARCGNGRVEGTEQCDDGNDRADDSCRPDCTSVAPITWTHEVEVPGPLATTSAEPIVVAGATLAFSPAAGEEWLVLLSGRVTSTSEAQISSHVELRINGAPRATLGHQTYGLGEGWAGFLVFDRVTGGRPTTAEAYFGAIAGETRLADVHLVAARLPPGAELVSAEGPNELEATGLGVDLVELKIAPATSGRYLILAQATVSEAPGADTAELWLLDDQGQKFPSDVRGAGWVNGRTPDAPAFIAVERNLAGQTSFRLQGNSSATNNDGWWDAAYQRRMPLTLVSDFDVPAGTQVSVTLDHSALIAAGLALGSGDDLRIVTADGSELNRVLDDDSSWAAGETRLWFRTAVDLAAGTEATEHYLYYANPNAGPPPADPDVVFELHDGFDGTAIDPVFEVRGAPALGGGQLSLGPGASIGAAGLLIENRVVEARLAVAARGPASKVIPLATFDPQLSDLTPVDGFQFSEGTWSVLNNTFATTFTPTDPESFQRWRIARRNGEVIMHQAFTERGRGPVLGGNPSAFGLATVAEAELSIEWVRVRSSVGRDPVSSLGTPEGPAGTSPSTWRWPRIVAFRLDAFPQAATRFDPALVATTTGEPQILSRLDVPAAAAAGDRLVIQAVRVAGDSDAAARKQGLLRIDGDTVLATSHRINRDGSRDSGYHHLAGLVDVRSGPAAMVLENAIASPDGITVEGAASSIVVLSYPPR